jgi:hypothetical protein
MSIFRTLCLSSLLALGYSGTLAAQGRFDSTEVVTGFYASASLSQPRAIVSTTSSPARAATRSSAKPRHRSVSDSDD